MRNILFVNYIIPFQEKRRIHMDLEEEPPICNYQKFPQDKMGSMLSVATPMASAYSYPRLDIIAPPPALDMDAIPLSKPPLPKRVVSTPTPAIPVHVPTPVVTVSTLDVASPTETATLSVEAAIPDSSAQEVTVPVSSAKGGMLSDTFKKKKKDRKEKKGKKMKHVVQNTTRYDSNPAYDTFSREQKGHM